MNESEPSLKAAIEKLVGLYLAPSRFREPIKSSIEVHNSELDEAITMLKALEAQRYEGLRDHMVAWAEERKAFFENLPRKNPPTAYDRENELAAQQYQLMIDEILSPSPPIIGVKPKEDTPT